MDAVISEVDKQLLDKDANVNIYKESGNFLDMTHEIFLFGDVLNAAEDPPSKSSANMTQQDLQKIIDVGVKRIKVKKKQEMLTPNKNAIIFLKYVSFFIFLLNWPIKLKLISVTSQIFP